ncbi:MAG: 1-acyl-sn-glycerol-3-phosphate acyltransferase [Oscillospiraceae bacterium]|nr:1-acyl-sn-glycerol-3-phosphate acyltransferase [Oscillospiraceae bacterium]
MIFGGEKDQVIENIRAAAGRGEFHAKVEVDDPNLTDEQKAALVREFWEKRKRPRYSICNRIARVIENTAAKLVNGSTQIEGLENLKDITGGAVITSNHFNPVDNTAVFTMVKKTGRKRLFIISQESNLAMTGLFGFLMNYADTVPMTTDPDYLAGTFLKKLAALLDGGNWVLIYPEQEMWFNYRKPRPPKRGAYYYAAKCGVPVVSCFVEIIDLPEKEKNRDDFRQVRYVVHVLPPVYPQEGKNVRQNSIAMMEKDYEQKRAAYEKAYGKPLTYDFEDSDIAGWIPAAAR